MASDALPSVVIVGRTNVGKSALFNRLSVNARSITFDQPGVTRDIIKDIVIWQNRTFELIDTGGISLRKTKDPIEQAVRMQALEMLKKASVVLLVVDNQTGLLEEDREIARLCREYGKTVAVVVNKVDNPEMQLEWHEFEQLGYQVVIPISALHGTGAEDVLDFIVTHIETITPPEPERGCRVVLLGKPNVGKSSLMNLLVDQERSIVSEVAGTTREPISERITFYQHDMIVTDLPGIRKKRAIADPLEQLMVKTAFKALDAADIVLLLVDGSQEHITDQELKLAFYAFEQHKALIILFNKSDLADQSTIKSLTHHLELYQHLLKKVEQLTISCKTGKNVGKILPLVHEVWERYQTRFNDLELAKLFKWALERRPLFHKTKPLMVHQVRQIGTKPPTILLTTNEPTWFQDSQLGYFDNVLREQFQLRSVPIKFVVRKD